MASESTLRSVLLATDATSHYIDQYFLPKTTLQNILSAIATHMGPYRAIAAAWYQAAQAGRTFSLNDWISHPRVLVLGEDETNRAALAAVNRLIFTRATELLLNQPERCRTSTWVFLDELRDLGRLDALNRLLLKGRSKNVSVVLGFQDIEGLREVYGDKIQSDAISRCVQLMVIGLFATVVQYAGHLLKLGAWRNWHPSGARLGGTNPGLTLAICDPAAPTKS